MTTHPTDETPGTPRTDPAEELTQAIDIDMYQAGFMLELDEREVVLNAVRKYLTHQTALLRQKDEALRDVIDRTAMILNQTNGHWDTSKPSHVRLIRVMEGNISIANAALIPKSPTP